MIMFKNPVLEALIGDKRRTKLAVSNEPKNWASLFWL
jgi:hypothetical protein